MKKLLLFLSIVAIMFAESSCTNKKEHLYVDLGLPSGTLWATRNVGASNPKAYGGYYAWGETEQKFYEAESYKYSNGGKGITKYCDNSEYGFDGFTDTLTHLQPEDDAATVNWGNDWETPSLLQWKELIDHCIWTWDSTGYRVIGPNGNCFFLPASGDCTNRSPNKDAGTIGVYWTSSLYSGTMAWGIVITNKSIQQSLEARHFGMSVRPVQVSKVQEASLK